MARPGVFLLLLSTALPTARITAQAQALELAPLPGYRGVSDCTAATPAKSPCRITAAPAPAEIARQLGAQRTAAWVTGESWTLAYQALDDSVQGVELLGGLQLPMSRLRGTRLWLLTLRIPGADSAVISYDFWPNRGAGPSADTSLAGTWRGPRARPAPATSATLQGTLRFDTLWSPALKLRRPVTSYLPPKNLRRAGMAVVYLADGQTVSDYAGVVEPLILNGTLPPLLLVGVWNAQDRGTSGTPADDMRGVEYIEGVEGMPGVDSAAIVNRRKAHETFFTEEVRRWAEDVLGASRRAQDRAIHGVSNGGSFALRMGRNHPEIYGGILANSHGSGADIAPPRGGWGGSPAYYLSIGLLEVPRVIRAIGAVADTLTAHQRTHRLVIYPSGHDPVVWREMFPVEVAWWLQQAKR